MLRPVFSSPTPVILLGAAHHRPDILTAALTITGDVIAADGGADHAFRAGIQPRAVIGDMDSITKDALERVPGAALHKVSEQETTDFEKCLARVDAPLVLAVGFLGGRLDHTLAVLNTLVRYPTRKVIVMGQDDIAFALPPAITIGLPEGARFSLFPICPVTGRSKGLQWSIDGIEFAPQGRIGTSNRVLGGQVTLAMDNPGMIAMLAPKHLSAVIAALRAA